MIGEFNVTKARKLLRLLNGESIPFSSFVCEVSLRLETEGFLAVVSHGRNRTFRMLDPEGCRIYMAQHYTSGMSLEDWIEIKTREKEVARSEQVAKGANSKLRHTRAFKGFPLNCYEPIEAVFHEEPYLLSPARGTCIFMQDYESFRIPEDVVVVGMENGENFRYIRAQKYLFEGMKVLFVSRYPQSKDLCAWLKMIPNRYIHFGDFD